METPSLEDRSRSSNDMQHTSTMQTESHVDIKTFRRSQRLQSILGKMRESRDDEWGQRPVEAIKSVEPSTTWNHTTGPSEVEDRDDQNSDGKSLQEEKAQASHSEDQCRQTPDSPREPDEIQAREEEIREQIHVAVQDIIISSISETKTMSPRAIETVHPDHPMDQLDNNSPRGQLATRPISPTKSNSAKKPALTSRSASISPKKQRGSENPRSPVGSASRRSKAFAKKKALQDDLMDDSSESELSTDQRPLLSTRKSKTPKKARNNTENKSISSDDSSASSSDSSGNDSASVASTGTSSDGYSTSSSLKKRESTKNAKGTHLAVDTTDFSAEPAKVSSPITEQASDFIKNLVKNLKLHETFRVPDKIKSHVKSEPIKSPGKATQPRSKSSAAMSDEEENSIIKQGASSQSPRARPPKGDFKLTTLPRKDVMQELREKLAERRKSHSTSTESASVLEKSFPSSRERRQKLTSQVLKESEAYIETIPRLVSADTDSVPSRRLASDDNCGANCGTLLCLGDSAVPPKPVRVKWQRGDFLTVKEAMLALDNSDRWDGVSTIASARGPSMSVSELSAALSKRQTSSARGPSMSADELSAALAKRRTSSASGPSMSAEEQTAALAKRQPSSKAKVPNASNKETTSLEVVHETPDEDSDHKKHQEDKGPVAALPEANEQALDTRKNDDGASLAYSVATEDEKESTIDQSGSDDSSMVPLRHGQRELSKPSIPRLEMKEQTPRFSAPLPDLTSQQLVSAKSSSEELVIALSLSEDSNNLIPSPQSQKNDCKKKESSGSKSTHEEMIATMPADPAPSVARSSNKSIDLQNHESHQEELFAKIEEFQKRRSQRASEYSEHGDKEAPRLVEPRSVQRVPVPAEAVELPKASKKVAQAYVDALTKKLQGKVNIPIKQPSTPKEKTVVQSRTQQPTGKVPNKISPPQSQSSSPISITKKLGLDILTPNPKPVTPNPQPQSPEVDVPHSTDGNAKVNHSNTQRLDSRAAVNVDDLVSRIDSVVHRLIETGKIDPRASSMEGSDLEQRTLRSNTAELLQNLAILRARRSFGASSRNEKAQLGTSSSTGGGVSSVPKSLVVTHNTMAGSSSNTRIGSSYDSPSIPRFERKNIQDLRAKRDQAANAVRLSAQRLSGMSRDISENTNILQETTRPTTIGRSFSSVKEKGPPKPENYSGIARTSRPIPTSRNPPSESFSTIATTSTIARDQHRIVISDDLRGSWQFPITLPSPVTSDMGSWEQEQLQQLPVVLQTTFSGVQGSGGRNPYDFGTQDRELYSTGSELDTENTSSVGDDDTTEYGSDDDSARLLRIESMIHELRARRLRL